MNVNEVHSDVFKVMVYDKTEDIYTETFAGFQEFEFANVAAMVDFVALMVRDHGKAVVVSKE